MIPKVIHYCWFGGKKKSKLIKDCIRSWKHNLPDYEIIEWNEKNTDLTFPFVKDAYKLKKWAFVADYIRLKVLYDRGGIYLDTDMLVLKPLDNLLFNNCFFGAESAKFISAGIIGAEKKNNFIKKCLSKYESINFYEEKDLNKIVMPLIITGLYRTLFNYNLSFDFDIKQNDVKIYPPQIFYPLPNHKKHDIKNYKNYIDSSTLAVHLWAASWVEYSEFYYLKKRKYFKGLFKVFKTILYDKKVSLSYIKKIGYSIKYSITRNNIK